MATDARLDPPARPGEGGMSWHASMSRLVGARGAAPGFADAVRRRGSPARHRSLPRDRALAFGRPPQGLPPLFRTRIPGTRAFFRGLLARDDFKTAWEKANFTGATFRRLCRVFRFPSGVVEADVAVHP